MGGLRKKITAINNYKYNVKYNATHYFDNLSNTNKSSNNKKKNRYYDPDFSYLDDFIIKSKQNNQEKNNENSKEYLKFSKEITIKVSQDGLCSYKRIEQYIENKSAQKYVYLILRYSKEQFNLWPCHYGSINCLKALLLKDRLDYTLMDISNFYTVINRESKEDIDAIIKTENYNLPENIKEEIEESCILSSAYLNKDTFLFLLSFEHFDTFVKKMKFDSYIKRNKEGKLIPWNNEETDIEKIKENKKQKKNVKNGIENKVEFSKEYFYELILRTMIFNGLNGINVLDVVRKNDENNV